jgi:hypothetical protein
MTPLSRTPRSPNRFRERELARMLRAGRSAGAKCARVALAEDGKIIADFDFIGDLALGEDDCDRSNPWDEVLADAADKKRPS